jgi:hypothetical protein
MAHSIATWITSGGAVATVMLVMRAIYLLGSILESFRSHVAASRESFDKHDERLRYLERRTQ